MSLLAICLFNYIDTVTDFVTAVGMFREKKYVLGILSILVMIVVGWFVPATFRSLIGTGSDGQRRFRRKWSWKRILAICTFSSTQHFIIKKFLLNHGPENKYDRKKCSDYRRLPCRTNDCNNMRHKFRQIYRGMIVEKMWENQPQFILQIINVAPDYVSSQNSEPDFWFYWKLTSLIFTIVSLARSCVSYNFSNAELKKNTFSFHSIGTGWYAIHPQKWLLFIVHASAIASKFLTVIFLMILVNHDFSLDVKNGSCSLSTTLNVIRSQSESSCYFETKVTWLYFLYFFVWYVFISLTAVVGIMIIYWENLKTSLSEMQDLVKSGGEGRAIRIKFIGMMSGIVLLQAYVARLVVLVLTQRHYMSYITNHLPNLNFKVITFGMKILPSLIQASGTVIFSAVIYTRGDDRFSNIDIGISPFHLTMVAVGIEVLHVTSLLLMVYWADPQHVQSLSDEKKLEILILMDKIDDNIDVSCSRKAKDIIKEVIEKNEGFDVYQEDIQTKIKKMAKTVDTDAPVRERMERDYQTEILTIREALLKYAGIEVYRNSPYIPLPQHPNGEGADSDHSTYTRPATEQ